jgi:hypothetical protein
MCVIFCGTSAAASRVNRPARGTPTSLLLDYLFAPADRQRLNRFAGFDGVLPAVTVLSSASQTFIAESASATQPNPVREDAGALLSCGSRRGPSRSFLADADSFSGLPFIRDTSGPERFESEQPLNGCLVDISGSRHIHAGNTGWGHPPSSPRCSPEGPTPAGQRQRQSGQQPMMTCG